MKTKLVYVLTCDAQKYYIEQALMSVYTARYYNPEAWIVLIVDDKTDVLLGSLQSEVLQYISEKIVIPFNPSDNSFLRSRLLKTQARSLIKGDYLFIDCDTIVTSSLAEIDNCPYSVAAVLESLLYIHELHQDVVDSINKRVAVIDCDASKEDQYFSSGVMFVKDNEQTHRLYELWHNYFLLSYERGTKADQPALLRADMEMGHIIEKLDVVWNGITYTEDIRLLKAKILHISSYRLSSFLFSQRVLAMVREKGLSHNDFLKQAILHPLDTFVPFLPPFFSFGVKQYLQTFLSLAKNMKLYAKHIDNTFADIDKYYVRLYPQMVKFLRRGLFHLAALEFVGRRLVYVCRHKEVKNLIHR